MGGIINDLAKLGATPEVNAVIEDLASVGIALAEKIALGDLEGALDAAVGQNFGGDGQKALDVLADEAFIERLKGGAIRYYASEEKDDVITLNSKGALALAIDPLDGSSNIDANVSIGTIFSILPAGDDGDATFLQNGSAQLAAGYIVFGPQTALVVTAGKGTFQYIFDRSAGKYRLAGAMTIAKNSTEFAINASNHRHWSVPIRSYVEDCLAGENGPLGSNYNMRWIASLVAETHRILSRGGIFLYPGDAREGYHDGRLRMIYECAPIAFVVEQAGGTATNGTDRVLDRRVETLHGRTGFVFGSSDNVDRVSHYHDLPESEISPLFNKRGLFG